MLINLLATNYCNTFNCCCLAKPPSNIKANKADSKRKLESIDSHILKKACKGLVHWTDKYCRLCKKHGGGHNTHNTCDCYWYNSQCSARPCQKECNPQGANNAQIVCMKCKKAFRTAFKNVAQGKKRHDHCNKRGSDSNSDLWSVGLDSTGELYVCEKLKHNKLKLRASSLSQRRYRSSLHSHHNRI